MWLSQHFARKGLLERQDHKIALDNEKVQLTGDITQLNVDLSNLNIKLRQAEQENDALKVQHQALQAELNQVTQRWQQAKSEQHFNEKSKEQDIAAIEKLTLDISSLIQFTLEKQEQLAELALQSVGENNSEDANAIYQQVEQFQSQASALTEKATCNKRATSC